MTSDYAPSLLRSFERHLRAENRSDNTIESYLESIRQAEAFLAARGWWPQWSLARPRRRSSWWRQLTCFPALLVEDRHRGVGPAGG